MNLALGLGLPYGAAGAAFDPADTNPLAWYEVNPGAIFTEESGTGAVAADGPVGYIADLSGNGHHIVQPVPGARPLFRSSGGFYSVEFDGTDDWLGVAWDAITQPITMVSAVRLMSLSTLDRLFGSQATGCQLFQNGGNYNIFSGSVLAGGAAVEDADVVITEVYDGNDSAIAIDNGAYVTGAAGASGVAGLTVGNNENGVDGDYAHMMFVARIVLNRLASASEIAGLRTRFAALQGRVL